MFDWATAGMGLTLACCMALYIGRRGHRNRTAYPLPPGPPGLPWVGNVIGVDPDAPWLTYVKWARTYGDLVYTQLLGNDIILINSEKIAKDLLETRSKIYSDRPHFITVELSGQQFTSSFMPYGDRWRLHRRFFHQTYRLDAVGRFFPYQHRKACAVLQQLLATPEKLGDHLFEYTASVVLYSAYNYEPTSPKDRLVELVTHVSEIVVPVLRPDISILTGAFPWLLYLPSWFPGMSFKRNMALARDHAKEYLERPFEYALQRVNGNTAPSMVHDAMRHLEEEGISPTESWMEALKEASGTAFVVASETSNAVLLTFFLMMVVNPAIQEKAQAQIDAVVGRDRLPGMEDRPLLPLIDAIYRETLRYSPAAPLSVPHVAVDDDVYGGYHIPKGALLITNLWGMAHDESRYSNAHSFIPERFLNEDGSLKPDDMEHITFGFGRRICVGRHFADTSVWAVMAKVLAVFKILRSLDENGVEIPVEPKFTGGIVIHPVPFKYRIVPRREGLDAERLAQLIAASTP